MNRKLLIKILELLEETYPRFYHAGKLMKKVGLYEIDGEFSKIIRYLTSTHKIILVPSTTSEDDRLVSNDEITINPEGIDFLSELILIKTREKLNRWIVYATIVIAISTLVNLLFFALK